MTQLKIERKVINASYMIAADVHLPYNNNGDSFVYYNPDFGWGKIDKARRYKNELLLVKEFEDAKIDKRTLSQFNPIPVFVETVISTVNSESFDNYTLQFKREKAMAKLTDEDMIALD